MTVCVTLAYPPSANRLWRNVKGKTLKSAAYRAWLANARITAAVVYPPETIAGPYTITIVADRPDKRRRDLGNLEKPISDCLQQYGYVADDANAQRIVLEWGEYRSPATVHVTLEAA